MRTVCSTVLFRHVIDFLIDYGSESLGETEHFLRDIGMNVNLGSMRSAGNNQGITMCTQLKPQRTVVDLYSLNNALCTIAKGKFIAEF